MDMFSILHENTDKTRHFQLEKRKERFYETILGYDQVQTLVALYSGVIVN